MRALFNIDVVKAGSCGTAAGTPERAVTRNTFDYALFLEFDCVADHDTYQTHPDHQVFVQRFSPWFKTVRIFDAEIV